MSRPSYREIDRKIKQAKEAVLGNRISILNPVSVAADTLELGLNLRNISNILTDLLEEIKRDDYAGQYPPQRSYEDEIEDCELLAFRWLSKKLGCRVYFKFTPLEKMPRCSATGLRSRLILAGFNDPLEFLTGFTIKEDKLWLVSLHEDRKESGGG